MMPLRCAATLGDSRPAAQEAVDEGVVEPEELDELVELVDEDADEPEAPDESEAVLVDELAEDVLFDGLVALLEDRESVL